MTTYKSQADAIMNGMEMFARINGFMVQHNEVMERPTNNAAIERVYTAVERRQSPHTEDTHVKWVYRYYNRLAVECFNASYEFDKLVEAYQGFQDYRFPKPMSQASINAQWEERKRIANQPKRLVHDLAVILHRHRPWFQREYDKTNGDVHPAVLKAWDYAEPANWHQLVMEWPHASKEGDHKIAYTRDEKYGEADRQLVTSVTKYLTRHWPTLNSNIIRDISAMYVEAKFGFVHTMPEMLDIIENGPGSCMSGDGNGFNTRGRHPYEAYDPEHGWHMAYIKEGEEYTGRVLLNGKTWVRTYRRKPGYTYSDTDERLNSWLREQGYAKECDWVGYRLKRIDSNNDCGFLAPYLDGDNKDVTVFRDRLEVVPEGDGEYICSDTMGDATVRSRYRCACCNDSMDEDNSYGVGRHCDESVCRNCYENDYTTVYGRRGEQYAVPNDDAIEVDGQYYDPNWLEDNSIVQLHDGEYTHSDNAVYIDSCSEYYPSESEYICYTQDGDYELRDDCVELENGEWCLSEEAWCCDHSGDYYANSDETPVATKCGKRIHKDYADEYEMENDDASPVSAE